MHFSLHVDPAYYQPQNDELYNSKDLDEQSDKLI